MIDGIYDLGADAYHADPADQPSLSSTIARRLLEASPLHGGGMRDLMPPWVRERFLSKIVRDSESGCWLWIAGRDPDGYAQFMWRGHGTQRGHRIAYEHFVGLIPRDLVTDHLCRVCHCVNPLHLEVVTPAENSRRGISPLAARTHCNHGHEFTVENTNHPIDGGRRCRTCHRERMRRARAAA